jgi:hypothetical protein
VRVVRTEKVVRAEKVSKQETCACIERDDVGMIEHLFWGDGDGDVMARVRQHWLEEVKMFSKRHVHL